MQDLPFMVIDLIGITKDFPGVRALDQVQFSLRDGQITGLVGENGAGKSTLMKILSGVYAGGSFSGQLLKDGINLNFKSPLDAEAAGIAIIHQELSGFSQLTVAENFYVGRWPLKKACVDWQKMSEECSIWLNKVGANCKPSDLMLDLGLGQQQLVEIAKSLRKNCQVLIFDEPTSSLTPSESKKLFDLIFSLKTQGHSIVYISHRMDEIFSLCDRVVVLRDGKSVASVAREETNSNEIVEWMVGRSIDNIYPQPPSRKFGAEIIKLDNYSAKYLNGKSIGPLTFHLRKGEVLGLGGLLGAGRSEIAKIIFGDNSVISESGSLQIMGKPRSTSPHEAINNGIVYVSEDRKGESLFPERNLSENTMISWLSCLCKQRLIDPNFLDGKAQESLVKLNTRFAKLEQSIADLSGGNQQKVILARALTTHCPIIILDEPTRGIDVNAKNEIYEIIYSLATEGFGILLISSDLNELMAMSDRILMVRQGQIAGESLRQDFDQDQLMKMAFGLNS